MFEAVLHRSARTQTYCTWFCLAARSLWGLSCLAVSYVLSCMATAAHPVGCPVSAAKLQSSCHNPSPACLCSRTVKVHSIGFASPVLQGLRPTFLSSHLSSSHPAVLQGASRTGWSPRLPSAVRHSLTPLVRRCRV